MSSTKKSVPTHITEYFQEQIDSGAWQVGQKIPSENVLSAQLGVSRSSVRAAIAQFVALGLLKSHQGQGTFLQRADVDARMGSDKAVPVAEFQNISKVLEYRMLIEPYAMQQAGENSDPEELADILQAYLNEMKSQIGNAPAFIDTDMKFHLMIARMSGNEVLADSLQTVFERTLTRHKQINSLFGYADGISYHQKIIEDLQDGDVKKAAADMKEHLQNALQKLKAKEERARQQA